MVYLYLISIMSSHSSHVTCKHANLGNKRRKKFERFFSHINFALAKSVENIEVLVSLFLPSFLSLFILAFRNRVASYILPRGILKPSLIIIFASDKTFFYCRWMISRLRYCFIIVQLNASKFAVEKCISVLLWSVKRVLLKNGYKLWIKSLYY